ncbi:RraA family protein [Streptomyces odontomachi]|uniref:RraA family protein n=1 Tax=Streptomyces odontomachi TaxID=2944940 RepID=UPI00210DE61C|nr:RraA family protein [Streptomyces sp. ODS25]
MRTPEERRGIRSRFTALETATVADVLDSLGLHDQSLSPDLRAVCGDGLAGWAYTIVGHMQPSEVCPDPAKIEACDGIGPDEVSVWSGQGVGICYFGEMIAVGMREHGSVGALVDGGVRDVRWLRHHRFPVVARYVTPTQSLGRWRVIGRQVPVRLPGATSTWTTIRPGDFVLSDDDGTVVIPDEHVDEALVRAERLTESEARIRAALADGSPLAECVDRFGNV